MLLAQATSAAAATGLSASTIGTVVLSLGVLASLGIAVFGMFLSRREHEAHKEEVGRRITVVEETVQSLDDKIVLVREEIHKSEVRISAAGEGRAVDLHSRFNEQGKAMKEIAEAVAFIKGRLFKDSH